MSGPIAPGTVAPELREEFPELRLWTQRVAVTPGRSPTGVREQLRLLAARMHGARAIQLRTEPVPHAYRVFFRHIGLDPDVWRTPPEELAVTRLQDGGLPSRGLVQDALTIALAETAVGVWAVDAATVDGPLELRPARAGERVGQHEHADDAGAGRLVLADARGPVALLFRTPPPPHAPHRATAELLVYAVQVAGVPLIHVEEALYLVASALADAR